MNRVSFAEPRERPSRSDGFHVLIVEDDGDLRSAIQEVFAMHGQDVDTAPDGIVAIEMAHHQQYDVVVSDIRLPNLDGIGVAQHLRDMTSPPRMILITAYPEWRVFEAARAVGIHHIVQKPLDLLALLDLVRTHAPPHQDCEEDRPNGR